MRIRKVINNNIVDIENIELFTKAAEGEAIYKKEAHRYRSDICTDKEAIRYAKVYTAMYNSLPFPLNSIEEDIKYAVIGNLIKECVKNTEDMWVDNALFIRLRDNRVMRFKYIYYNILNSWERDGKDINIENFSDSTGYREYSWVLRQLLERKTTPNFYVAFMRNIVQAVGFDMNILKYELSNILNIKDYVKSIFKANTVIDTENGNEYTLDIFYKEKRRTGDKSTIISLVDNSVREKDNYTKVYSYDTYIKEKDDENNQKPRAKTQLVGMHHIFNKLIGIKNGLDEDTVRDYVGIIVGRDLIFVIDNVMYVTKAYRVADIIEVGESIELIGYSRGSVYYKQSEILDRQIIKEEVYEYTLKDNIKHLCSIRYL